MRKNARIKDHRAVEIIRALKIDTKPYDKFMSHEGVIARTIMLDRQLKEIIRENPDTVIVNPGAGFDSRFDRVDNGRIFWFDMDLPDSIAARKKAFDEKERVKMIVGNVLESAWCSEVKEIIEERKAKNSFGKMYFLIKTHLEKCIFDKKLIWENVFVLKIIQK